jgi:hypothetical protein
MRKLKGLHAPKWELHFNYGTYFHLIPDLIYRPELLWKEKYETPRVEITPWINFMWLWFEFTWRKSEVECEWWLWLHHYNKGNLSKALSSWPWRQIEPKEENELFGVKG